MGLGQYIRPQIKWEALQKRWPIPATVLRENRRLSIKELFSLTACGQSQKVYIILSEIMHTEVLYWLLLYRVIKVVGSNLERIIILVFVLTRFSLWLCGSVHMGKTSWWQEHVASKAIYVMRDRRGRGRGGPHITFKLCHLGSSS